MGQVMKESGLELRLEGLERQFNRLALTVLMRISLNACSRWTFHGNMEQRV